jgi:hypothetical protein
MEYSEKGRRRIEISVYTILLWFIVNVISEYTEGKTAKMNRYILFRLNP